jgi:hypothetical protein
MLFWFVPFIVLVGCNIYFHCGSSPSLSICCGDVTFWLLLSSWFRSSIVMTLIRAVRGHLLFLSRSGLIEIGTQGCKDVMKRILKILNSTNHESLSRGNAHSGITTTHDRVFVVVFDVSKRTKEAAQVELGGRSRLAWPPSPSPRCIPESEAHHTAMKPPQEGIILMQKIEAALDHEPRYTTRQPPKHTALYWLDTMG